MSGLEVAGLGLAVVGTIDLCFKYGNLLIDTCNSFKNAEAEIGERLLRVRSHCKRTKIQLDFIKQIWETLDEKHRSIQTQILQVLINKLRVAGSKLDKVIKKESDNGAGQSRIMGVKRGRYAVVKQYMDETIQDLESWQKMFDPSWFLIIKVSDSLIDQEIRRPDSAISSFPAVRELRNVTRQESSPKSVFLSEDGLNFSTAREILFSSVKCVQKAGSEKYVVIDSIQCDGDVDIDAQTKDVRELARKLSCVDPFAFGILQCQGVIRRTQPGVKRPSSFDFVFRVPQELRTMPRSFRSCLSSATRYTLTDRFNLVEQIAKSVGYVHTLGFVHKIRPETILAFQTSTSDLGAVFLTGFEKVRLAEGRTRLTGDSAWEKNIYRHPHRQGMKLEETYSMQHDIYSLGVCLLELGMWESFVSYEKNTGVPVPASSLGIRAGAVEFQQPALLKGHLVASAGKHLPVTMGIRYAQIVINCLTCLDDGNIDFGDKTEFEDEDGVLVGVRYIDKILLKLDDIVV